MNSFHTLCALLTVAVPVFAGFATTTRYNDGSEGACGCGSGSPFSWQYDISTNVYTAAGSQVLFDADGSSWCGAGCGVCYNLTNQGYSACSTCGTTAGAGESIIVMVTNLCPYGGNQQWCPPVGGKNEYGYGAHFDIMSTSFPRGNWDNPVVQYEQVDCPGAAATDWAQCICYPKSVHSTLTQSTPKPPTSTPSSTTKQIPASSSTPPSVSSGKASLYYQCGGKGWTGPTSCAVGSCVRQNDWYSQCLEASNAVHVTDTSTTPSPSEKGVPLYGQCGGKGWTGSTTCTEGVCTYQNDWYSQCVEDTNREGSCKSTPVPKRSRRHTPRHIN